MRVIGSLIGGWIGGRLLSTGGPVLTLVGVICGAIFGNKVESAVRESMRPHSHGGRRPSFRNAANPSMVFVASIAAMLAKMAKADGVVSQHEIAGVEDAFRRLGFTRQARQYAIDVFRKAKDDAYTIYDYAHEFASVVDSVDVRELLYEILWDVACADGQVSVPEARILHRIPAALGIRAGWYDYFASQRLRGYERSNGSARRDPLAEAYAVLGASAGDGNEELKRKYRELAKKNHPDALRAQGLPEEMVGKATERMSRINEAWSKIKEARGL